MAMTPPNAFITRPQAGPSSEDIQQILNSQEETLPADILRNDLPAQEVTDEKPKKRTKKKIEEKINDPDLQNFKESTKRLSLQTVFDKMARSEQKTVIVKEVKIEESFDFVGSMAQLQKTFETEYSKKVMELDALYKSEIQRIKDKAALKNIAQMMAETVVGMRRQGWAFNVWQNAEVISKYFTPFLPLTDCLASEGWIRFNEPFCLLKAIHVDYLQKRLGNIYVETQGVHPNVHHTGSRGACTGTLSSREIDILNSKSFLVLLDEIERAYKFGNLTSAFNGISTSDKTKYTILKTPNDIEKNKWY
jgi:hypothetical protein